MKVSSSFILSVTLFSLLSAPVAALAEPTTLWYRNLALEGGLTLVAQNSMGNNIDKTKDQMDFVYSADILITGTIDETQEVFFALEAGDGHSISDNIPTRAITNYDAYVTEIGGMTRLNISQAYYRFHSAGDMFEFAAGWMDSHARTDTNQFANDETTQFLNGMFVRSTGVVFFEMARYYSPTLYLKVQPVKFLSFTATYSNPDGFDIGDKKCAVAQLGLHPTFGEEGVGNYLFGYVLDKNEYTKIKGGGPATNSGFFASLDQAFTSQFGFFVRYAQTDDTIAQNEVISALSGGLSLNNLFGNEGNGAGLAYGVVELNQDIVKENNIGMDVIEFYIRFGLSPKTQLTLDFQRLNDLERADKRTVYVGGIRFQANM